MTSAYMQYYDKMILYAEKKKDITIANNKSTHILQNVCLEFTKEFI